MMPRFIYELMPFIYAPAGIASIVSLETTLGRLSGAMLLSASVAIYTLRKIYRGQA